MPTRTEIINQAIYVVKGSLSKDYISICDYCKKCEYCGEPNKKLRITCPNDTFEATLDAARPSELK